MIVLKNKKLSIVLYIIIISVLQREELYMDSKMEESLYFDEDIEECIAFIDDILNKIKKKLLK